MNPPALILIRAGATDFDTGPVERVRAWTDVPLNTAGQRQAADAAQALLATRVARVVSSDLARAQGVAERVVQEVGEPELTLTKGLRPWNLGDLASKPLKEAMPEIRRLLDNENEAAPNGESFSAFQSRALETFLPLAEEAKASRGAIVVVTHARVLRLIKGWLQAGGDPSGAVDMQALVDVAEPVPPGGIAVMQWTGQRWLLSDETALHTDAAETTVGAKESSAMRDPYDALCDNVAKEMMGFDYGGLFTGIANVAATGVQQAQQDASAGKAKASSAQAVQDSIQADVTWANALSVVEMTQDPSSKVAAQSMVQIAESDAADAGKKLAADGIAKRCEAAKGSLRAAAEAATKSPKDSAAQARFHAWQKVAGACGAASGGADDSGGSGDKGKGAGKHGGESWLTATHAGVPGWGWLAGGTTLVVIGVLLFRRRHVVG